MQRPVGVTILAVIAIIYGIFSLLLALLGLLGEALLASGFGNLASRASASGLSAGLLAYAAIVDAVLGILYLVFGIGAFSLKRWAWTAGVVVLVLDVVRQIVGFVIQGVNTNKIIIASITIVIALVLLGYLFRPNVRAAFGFARAA
jgi:uncharacterized membrane protein